MIFVILGIGVLFILLSFGMFVSTNTDEEIAMIPGVLGIFIFLISGVVAIVLGVSVSNLSVIDEKIAMYEEENQKIEIQIAEAVKQYQEYESGIFTEVAPESSVTLVALYPELKADTLVKKQVEVYIANNEKIKELKESDITGDVKRWWLYFGGKKK